ncbi:MAG: hypothetical protein NTV51_27480 [Verrucomicrobia bacterium]|nr:hypothetical protein [Verrucomicrobiota bacterium]
MRSLLHFSRLLILAAGLTGGALANPAPAPDQKDGPPVAVVAEIPLHFSARGNRLPVPLADARLYGADGLVIVDTGASHQAICRDFADLAGLTGTRNAAGRDHAGQPVGTERAPAGNWRVGPVQRSISDAVIVPGPASFGPLGIRGFLSPQNFFEQGYLVFDFPGGRLTVLAPTARLVAWLHERYPARPVLELARATDVGLDARKIYVYASLGDAAPIVAELDTGGSLTEFDESLLPPPAASDATATTSTAAGRTGKVRTVEGQSVRLGGHAFGPMKIKQHHPRAGVQALLGMDLLRQTVLVVPLNPNEPVRLLPKEN